jgi:WD40 repeat protein
MDVAFSPDNTMIASASGDHTIILWHIDERRPIGNPLVGHSEWVNALAFSTDGQHLFSGGRDGQLIVWPAGVRGWQSRACQIANRNFVPEELRQYFRSQSPLTQCKEIR